MPSIHHLAVNSRVQNHPSKTQTALARTAHFGMQPNAQPQESDTQRQNCCSGLIAGLAASFRNLFLRRPQAQQSPALQMREQESIPLNTQQQPNYQSLDQNPPLLTRPVRIRQASGPGNASKQTEKENAHPPIHILALRNREDYDRQRTGLGIPFSPPEVSEAKRLKQKKYSAFV